MELKTERLKLVPCTEESVMKYVCSLADTTSHVKNCLNNLKKGEKCAHSQTWLLIEENKGIIIGEIVMTKGKDAPRSVHMTFRVMSYAKNKGYAVEALKALFRWVFQYGGVQSITAECSNGDVYKQMIFSCLQMTQKKESASMISWELKKETSELVR